MKAQVCFDNFKNLGNNKFSIDLVAKNFVTLNAFSVAIEYPPNINILEINKGELVSGDLIKNSKAFGRNEIRLGFYQLDSITQDSVIAVIVFTYQPLIFNLIDKLCEIADVNGIPIETDFIDAVVNGEPETVPDMQAMKFNLRELNN